MLRIIAFVAVAMLGSMGLAHCQSEQRQTPARPVDKPSDTVPANPLDVPAWMGQAVENILTGAPAPEKPSSPSRQ